MKKILLGHLNSNGDCLYATVIARQIKEVDYPGCHLTWAVNSWCRQVVELNPYVDEIWEVPTEKNRATEEEWNAFVAEAEERRKRGDFDLLFFTQVAGENQFNYDGGVRSSTYNNYPHEITVPHQPVIRLSETEVENVRRFAEKHALGDYRHVILVECGPDSFEVALNTQSAYELALELTSKSGDVAVLLSSNKRIESPRVNVIDASELSFRENAELIKYCDIFIGCSSGISWLTTTDWAKKLNTILVIYQYHVILPSMIYDHEYLNLPTGHIIEIKSDQDSLRKLRDCVGVVLDGRFADARKEFNERIRLSNYGFLHFLLGSALMQRRLGKFFSCLARFVKRNGARVLVTPQFIKLIFDLHLALLNKLLKILGLKQAKLVNQVK